MSDTSPAFTHVIPVVTLRGGKWTWRIESCEGFDIEVGEATHNDSAEAVAECMANALLWEQSFIDMGEGGWP